MYNIMANIHDVCERKRKYAWAQYYKAQNELHGNQIIVYTNFKQTIKDFPANIKNELKEHYKQLRKTIECPICLEVIDLDDLHITLCGHKYDKKCFSKLDKCSICRKDFN